MHVTDTQGLQRLTCDLPGFMCFIVTCSMSSFVLLFFFQSTVVSSVFESINLTYFHRFLKITNHTYFQFCICSSVPATCCCVSVVISNLKWTLLSHDSLQFCNPLFPSTRDPTWWGNQLTTVRATVMDALNTAAPCPLYCNYTLNAQGEDLTHTES